MNPYLITTESLFETIASHSKSYRKAKKSYHSQIDKQVTKEFEQWSKEIMTKHPRELAKRFGIPLDATSKSSSSKLYTSKAHLVEVTTTLMNTEQQYWSMSSGEIAAKMNQRANQVAKERKRALDVILDRLHRKLMGDQEAEDESKSVVKDENTESAPNIPESDPNITESDLNIPEFDLNIPEFDLDVPDYDLNIAEYEPSTSEYNPSIIKFDPDISLVINLSDESSNDSSKTVVITEFIEIAQIKIDNQNDTEDVDDKTNKRRKNKQPMKLKFRRRNRVTSCDWEMIEDDDVDNEQSMSHELDGEDENA